MRRADEPTCGERRIVGTEIPCEPWMRTTSDHEPDPVARAEAVRDGVEVNPLRRQPGWTEPNEAVADIVGPVLGIHLAQPHEHVPIRYLAPVRRPPARPP